eukprot:Filipodium_phascolosomae@DN2776_c1_g1_i33.p1
MITFTKLVMIRIDYRRVLGSFFLLLLAGQCGIEAQEIFLSRSEAEVDFADVGQLDITEMTGLSVKNGGVTASAFLIHKGKAVKAHSENNELIMSFQLDSGALAQNDTFTIQLPSRYSFPTGSCQHTVVSTGTKLNISSCTHSTASGTFKLGAAETQTGILLLFGTASVSGRVSFAD